MPATYHRSGYLAPTPAGRTLVTLRAHRLAHGSGARLRRAAARLAGDDGLALACAMLEMITEGAAPAGWPIAKMIDLLDTPDGHRDCQVGRLVEELRKIEAAILANEEACPSPMAG